MGQNDYVVLRAIGTSDDTDLAADTIKYASKPSGALAVGEGVKRGTGIVYFIGTDANNETFAWTLYAYKNANAPAEFIATGTGILGTAQTGATNTFYADTIAVTSSEWNSNVYVIDSGNNRVAKLCFSACDYEYYYCVMTKTTCASMGAYIGFVNADGVSSEKTVATVDIGDVNLLNAAGTKINPATEGTLDAMSSKIDDLIDVTLADVTQAANTAWANGDRLMPVGGVRKNTRALPEDVTDGDWSALQVTTNGDLRTRDDDMIAALTPYTNAVSGYLTLSGSAQKLIPDWAVGTTYAAAKFVNHTSKIWYSLRETVGDTPGESPSDWQEVTPRAILLWANDDNTADVSRGSALRQKRTLAIGGTADKLSVDTDGALAIYVLGTASDNVEFEMYE